MELNSLCKLYEKNIQRDWEFYIKENEITKSLEEIIDRLNINIECLIEIICRPKSYINVRTISRCTSSLPGHTAAITTLAFSPDARNLATGSGDTTVRLWDINTETPSFLLEGHKDWILALAWSPNCNLIVSGDKSGVIIIWNVSDGKQKFPALKNHKKWITYISWEPLHL
ncbi:hypothetical protein MXB_4990 [Myxobolus squamalis]|nr:hypothetical protein MXB_4990 [Myxobolus squamalis]